MNHCFKSKIINLLFEKNNDISLDDVKDLIKPVKYVEEYSPKKYIETWKINGTNIEHNDNDLPSKIKYDSNKKTEYYCNYGKLQKRVVYLNDKLHSINGPAVIEYHLNFYIKKVSYYFNGKLHRDNCLPAVIIYDDTGEKISSHYFENGIEINKN